MKKIIVIFVVAFSFIVFFAYRFYDFMSFFEQVKKFGDLDYSGRAYVISNDSNLPDYLKKYYVDENIYKNAEKLYKIWNSSG